MAPKREEEPGHRPYSLGEKALIVLQGALFVEAAIGIIIAIKTIAFGTSEPGTKKAPRISTAKRS